MLNHTQIKIKNLPIKEKNIFRDGSPLSSFRGNRCWPILRPIRCAHKIPIFINIGPIVSGEFATKHRDQEFYIFLFIKSEKKYIDLDLPYDLEV